MRCSYILQLKAMIVLVLLILNLPSVNAKTFYVSTTGNDGNNGSISAPWRTIIYAWRHSGGGDTVLVRNGIYSERQMWLQMKTQGKGSENQFWTLKVFPDEEVVFTNARIIIDDSYVRIQGLVFRGDTGGNSYIQAVSWGGIHEQIEILDNRFIGSQKKPPLYFIGNNSLIQGNTVDITGSVSHGIYIMHGSNNIIRNNYVTGMAKYGLHIYDEDKYPNEPPAVIKNLIVENNIITSSSSNSGIIISSGADPPGGIQINNVVVRNNIIFNNKDYGIYIRYGGTNENIEIYNNTLYNNGGGIYINGSVADSITVHNNIFVSNSSGNINAHNVNTLTISHNLYWKPTLVEPGTADDHAVYQDPLFVNINEGDFRLQADSPAIDAGVDVGLPFNGRAPDLGAYEYGSSTIKNKK